MTTSPLPVVPDDGLYEARAQAAGETAYELLDYDVESGYTDGCNVCVVREILEAAWPYLRVLALQELADSEQPVDVALQNAVQAAADHDADLSARVDRAQSGGDDDEDPDDETETYEIRVAEHADPIALLQVIAYDGLDGALRQVQR